MQDRTPSPLLLFRWRRRSCASCVRDSIGRRANVAPDRFALFASCSPDVSREGGYKSFLATIGRYASTIVNSLAVVLPLSNRGRGARRRPAAHAAIVAPGNVNGSLTRPNHRRFLARVLLARASRRAGASPAVCGRATAASSFSRGNPAAAHIASAFCSRVTQYSHARSTPREPRLWPPHFSTSPGESGPGVPIASARSSALRVV